jgi:hypothetical protein
MWCWQMRMTDFIAATIRSYDNSYTCTIDFRGYDPLLQCYVQL